MSEPQSRLIPPEFEVGRTYRRRDIHTAHGGQQQGGISTPKDKSYLLLFTGTGEHYGYEDGWEPNGVYRYSSEGQVGDMTFTGGNKAIRDHAKDGKDLHLFKQGGKGRVQYLGCFACSSWERRDAKDKNDKPRQAIVFYLAPSGQATAPPSATTEDSTLPLNELRRRALEAGTSAAEADPKEGKRILYARSEWVRAYLLARANGTCESCDKAAPFKRPDGTFYLEPHHTRRVSDGGADHPRWVGAICPNCHREIHHGVNGSDLNVSLVTRLGVLESDAE